MLNSYFCNTLFKVKSFEDYVDLIENASKNILRQGLLELGMNKENIA